MPTPLEQTIEEMITPSLEALGYAVVRIRLFDGESRTLQIMAERIADSALSLGDCEKISRAISTVLDVEDPITDAYNLEVSSPGIDRPLVRLKDFANYVGHEAKMTLRLPVDGRKRYTGTLKGVTENAEILLQLPDQKEVSVIPLTSVDVAKLVLTDALIKANKTIEPND
jgi:ribosome maturation factor RimP